ncbi:hypothetical protein L2449_05580 [Mesorhizobium muleiense]|jgi:ribonuclease Z|uniref:hypothetical protein n=1 Tax=Mesorhizobium muleiense TaxID=1004279 RepID=UPI001F15C536|nr:hypothetical protein [Mesorhizobium muleiense]MCF6116391.1 hypothetical protein [Mesorhizobium muleiense]
MSGDTTLNDNVVKHGANADVIIHNVIAFSERLSRLPEMQGVLAKLTTPEQAADVFTRASPKMAVYSHIGTKPWEFTGEEENEGASKYFS